MHGYPLAMAVMGQPFWILLCLINKRRIMKTQRFIILVTCLLFACDKDDVGISHELKGIWNWRSTCGGFVGCVYSSPGNHMTMRISETAIVTTTSNRNGTSSTSASYQLIDKQHQDDNTIYTLKLTDGTIRVMTVSMDNLSSDSDLISTYYTRFP